jgi:molecular chaperone DnaK (HSP70)
VTPAQVDEGVLVGGSTRVPLVQRCVAERFGKEPRGKIDPMLVVATGAAVQAERLFAPGADASVLLDVTPHSLRVATAGGYSQVLIPKNTTIPAEGMRTFLTSQDSQTEVLVRVGQGEENHFELNVPVGELTLTELPARPRGETSLEVAFTIDADGILHVTAKDIRSGKQTNAVLTTVGHSETR